MLVRVSFLEECIVQKRRLICLQPMLVQGNMWKDTNKVPQDHTAKWTHSVRSRRWEKKPWRREWVNWAWQGRKVLGGQKYKPTISHVQGMELSKKYRNVWAEKVSLPLQERMSHLFVCSADIYWTPMCTLMQNYDCGTSYEVELHGAVTGRYEEWPGEGGWPLWGRQWFSWVLKAECT